MGLSTRQVWGQPSTRHEIDSGVRSPVETHVDTSSGRSRVRIDLMASQRVTHAMLAAHEAEACRRVVVAEPASAELLLLRYVGKGAYERVGRFSGGNLWPLVEAVMGHEVSGRVEMRLAGVLHEELLRVARDGRALELRYGPCIYRIERLSSGASGSGQES